MIYGPVGAERLPDGRGQFTTNRTMQRVSADQEGCGWPFGNKTCYVTAAPKDAHRGSPK